MREEIVRKRRNKADIDTCYRLIKEGWKNRGIGEREGNSAAVKAQEDVFFPPSSFAVPMSMGGGFMGTPLLSFGIAGDQSVQNYLTLRAGWSTIPHESTIIGGRKRLS